MAIILEYNDLTLSELSYYLENTQCIFPKLTDHMKISDIKITSRITSILKKQLYKLKLIFV